VGKYYFGISRQNLFAVCRCSIAAIGSYFYLFRQLTTKNESIWLAPIFTPIHFYVIVVFAINFILSLVSHKRDKFLSLAFNFTTLAVDVLLIAAMILNLTNSNG